MQPKNKKTYLIIGLVLAALFILAIALTIFRNNVDKAVFVENPDKEQIYFPKLLPDNSMYYFSKGANQIKKWDLANNKTETWIKFSFTNTNQIIYSPDLTQALVKTENPTNAADHQTYLVNLQTKKVIQKLSDNLLAVDWSPNSKQIAYHYLDWDAGTDQIVVSNPDGTKEQILTPIEFENINISWADEANIIYYNIPSEAFVTAINSISVATKKQQATKEEYYLGGITRIGSNQFLIDATKSESATTSLNILDATKITLTDLKSPSNVDKTAFSPKNNKVYAAYNKNSTGATSSDQFQAINLSTKKVSKLVVKIDKKETLKASNLMVSDDGKTLYFLSNNNLYKKGL